MLLRVDTNSHEITRVKSVKLADYKLKEQHLQDVLFRSFDQLFSDEQLLPIIQSRRWQEEPDIMAVDEQGNLYIFEIKVWESRSENLLQALRYGQIFGGNGYNELNQKFQKSNTSGRSLLDAHAALFNVQLQPEDFNRKQVFVIITNGLDVRTRQAIQYWRSCGLDIRSWIYRIYPISADNHQSFYIEMNRFSVEDTAYEDAQTGYYILNTNYRQSSEDHNDMVQNGKAAAYFEPWKHKIERLQKNDTVFLYQSRTGIVAVGRASGRLEKKAYHGEANNKEEEYCMALDDFRRIDPPISAAKIKEITGINYRFLSTMFSVDADSGKALVAYIQSQTVTG